MISFGFKGDALEGRARNVMNITRDHRAGTSEISELLVVDGINRAAFDGPGWIIYSWALIKDHKDAVFISPSVVVSIVIVTPERNRS
jgi:hypothetical protein